MQIKAADGRNADVIALERLLVRPDVRGATRKRIEQEIAQIRSGEKAERDAAYDIELYFGRSVNWATIHDLRIEVDGLAAQIDHLIINRLAEVWVCESKAFAEGVSVNEQGEWSRWWNGRQTGIASPLEQNHRHIHLLERVFHDGLVRAPKRLGLMPMKPRLRSLVLVSNNARIGRPKRSVKGMDEVIKAEQLKTRLFDEFDKTPEWRLATVIGKEGLDAFARELAALHRPIAFDWSARFGLAPTSPTATLRDKRRPVVAPPRQQRAPTSNRWLVKYDGPCSTCGTVLVKDTPAIWSQSAGKMFCLECARGSLDAH
jgi:hypothetical protein